VVSTQSTTRYTDIVFFFFFFGHKNLNVVINFNALNIHSISKITMNIYKKKKKDALDLSSTDGRGLKPKILGSSSMATFSVLPHLIILIIFYCAKRLLDMLLYIK
jgi:hypothetical protein